MGDKINYSCTRSLDPEHPVTYYFSSPFVLDTGFKMTICLISMIVVLTL